MFPVLCAITECFSIERFIRALGGIWYLTGGDQVWRKEKFCYQSGRVYMDDWLVHRSEAEGRGEEQRGDFGVNENAETRSIHRISYIIFSRVDVRARAREATSNYLRNLVSPFIDN